MSMNKIHGLMAATALMMGGMGTGMTRRSNYQPPERKRVFTPLGDTASMQSVPKGHKTEITEAVFLLHDGTEEYTFDVMVSWGTEGSKQNRINRRLNEIRNYLLRTPNELIHQRKEYKEYKRIEKNFDKNL